jgi:hypothetical protein
MFLTRNSLSLLSLLIKIDRAKPFIVCSAFLLSFPRLGVTRRVMSRSTVSLLGYHFMISFIHIPSYSSLFTAHSHTSPRACCCILLLTVRGMRIFFLLLDHRDRGDGLSCHMRWHCWGNIKDLGLQRSRGNNNTIGRLNHLSVTLFISHQRGISTAGSGAEK